MFRKPANPMRNFVLVLVISGFLLINGIVLFAQSPFVQPPLPPTVALPVPNPCAGPVVLKEPLVVSQPAQFEGNPILMLMRKIAEDIKLENSLKLKFAMMVTGFCLVSGDYQGARKIASRILEKRPQDADLLFLIGCSYSGEENLEKAMEYYLKAEKISENDLRLCIKRKIEIQEEGGHIEKLELRGD